MLMHALARAPLPIRTAHRHRSPSLLRLSPPRRWNILLARANADDDAHRNDDTQRAIEGLVQRAEQLRAEQLRMEREAAALADALEGLPASQQQVVLEALGLQPKQEQQEQEEQQGDRQQTVDEQQGDWQQTSDKQQVTGSAAQLRSADEQEMSGKDVPGSDTWLAALPPYLQDQLKASGLADVLQEQADVVRQNEEWSNSEQFGGGDMEALARLIEEGQELPPQPAEEWAGEPEPAEELQARMIGITEYMHADLKGSKHPRKQKTQRKSAARPEGDAAATAVAAEGAGGSDAEEAGGGEGAGVHDEEGANEEEERLVAEAEAAAAEHTTDTIAIRRAAELFAGRPDLAAAYGRGWGQSKEWDRMCSTGEVDEAPMTEDRMRGRPAPPLPPEARRVFKAAERIAYVLRRAHKDSTDPDAPLLALQSKGLASKEMLFQDPFIHCPSLDRAIQYLGKLRFADATVSCDNIFARCTSYSPTMEWKVTIDCFLDLPYPDWFYGWVNRNYAASPAALAAKAAQAAAADATDNQGPSTTAAGMPAAAGPYASVATPAMAAAEDARLSEQERQEEEDVALMDAMLAAAFASAKASGQTLDNAAIVDVMKTAAGVSIRKEQQRKEARDRAAAAALEAAVEADEALAEEERQPGGGAWRDPPLAEVAPPQLLEVHSAPYVHEGEKRRHVWVLMDTDERDRQRSRQQFDVYPRHLMHTVAGVAEQKEEEEEEAAEERLLAEQERQYALLQASSLLRPAWGLEGLSAQEQQGQQQQQRQGTQQQQGSQPQQQGQGQQQQGQDVQAAPASSTTGAGRAGSKKKRREAARAEEELRAAQQFLLVDEEEHFPFTFDWERQQTRQESGQQLRQLLGKNFEEAMKTVPKMGRNRGRNSNAAMRKEEDNEGTAWLGGQCMTVQVTYQYTMDASTCLVDTCAVSWGTVHGLHLTEVTDAFDIYLDAAGMLHEAEWRQDQEDAAELRQLGLDLPAEMAGGTESEEGKVVAFVPLGRQYELLAQKQQQQDL
ncbi:hypothetical protein D9Q98_000123 [Chlorella vulgaris]|uniref:Uncharacterized protein n=1 Tax=Chlorella vulgaris TaxID=3077 RepID=A0A9D4TXK1_CHLVU|nr:hypothetical protein D9Q98_000123 [Chlorella vulgaris]